MLSWRCRRFRARFSPAEPGAGTAHRRRCAECAAYAAALERMASARLPLPERLRADLSALALQPANRALGLAPGRLPVPPLPLPPALRSRLQGIAREAERPRPPMWIVSPRYAVAASLLLTVVTAALLGNPGELGARALGFVGREVRREVASPLAEVRATGSAELQSLRSNAVSRYTEVRGGVDASVEGLETRVSQIAGRLLPASPLENHPANRRRRTP
ncbi:MAG TPA: hypothetical protein VFE33_05885 [Thermoanaerobaculia bacterium]|nr:hypothetical protein [Thermoanaerobaculia bacterium]